MCYETFQVWLDTDFICDLFIEEKKKKATYTERGVRAFPQPSTGLRVEKKISQDLHTM